MGINNFVVSLDRATKRRHDEPVFFICATGVHGTHPQTPFMLLWDILFQCSCSYLREVSNDTNLEEHRDVDSRLRPLYKKMAHYIIENLAHSAAYIYLSFELIYRNLFRILY